MRYTYHYRSFFWPALIILVGLIALLVNIGQIPIDRVYQLIDLWPLILIVIGIEIIVRRSVRGAAGDVAAALIVLIAIVGAVAYVAVTPSPSATHSMDSSEAVANLDQASLEIDVGAATIDLSGSTDVGSDLYRAHVDYSGPQPTFELDRSTGRLKISQSGANFNLFQSRRFSMKLQLNPGIPWTITENSGAATDTIDVSAVHVTSLRINTGASHDEITLGPPSGAVSVEINGGALTVGVHRPAGTDASITVSGGAVNLDADGRSSHAIGRLSYQTSQLGADRYEIRVSGGACTVTLDESASSG